MGEQPRNSGASMKRVVSFSLWGDNPLYVNGAIANAQQYPEVFDGWICRFYHDDTVPGDALAQLKELPNVELRLMGRSDDVLGMYWRFHPMFDDAEIERLLVRDTDSRPTKRELAAVNEWIESGVSFHVIRDCESHGVPILGGTWGAVPGCIRSFELKMQAWFTALQPDRRNPRGLYHGSDQIFLSAAAWPIIRDTYCGHIRAGMDNLRFSDRDIELPPLEDNHYVGMVC